VDIRSAWLFLSRLFFLFFLPFSLHTFKWLWKENEIKIGDGKTKEGASAFVLLRDINKKKSRHMCLVCTYNCSTFHAPLLSIAGPAGADSETQKRTLIIITGYRVPPSDGTWRKHFPSSHVHIFPMRLKNDLRKKTKKKKKWMMRYMYALTWLSFLFSLLLLGASSAYHWVKMSVVYPAGLARYFLNDFRVTHDDILIICQNWNNPFG
jgi:hypothetical protein